MANDFNLDQFPLPKDWTRQELIDCTEDGNISYGIVQPGKHLDEGIPVLRVNNIGNNSLDLDAVMKVDPKIEEKYLRTRLLGGEVLLTLVGSTGQSIIAPEYMKGWNVARAIAVIRADENIGADWINICLQSRETHHYLNSRANTTVQKTLNLKDVRSIPIPIPPLKTKLFIENIATSLSKKIELNRQMNETLEAMAQALFKSWFVDFDPVIDNALAASNAIPDELLDRAEQRKEIEKKDNSDIQSLFPAEFEFTKEMGWIPKGWSIKKAEEIASITIGKTPPRKEPEWFSDTQKDNLVWVSIRDMGNSNVFIGDSSEYLTKESIKKFNVKVIPKNSVILSFKLTLGRVLIAQKELATNEAIAHFFNPRFSMSKEYVYCYLSNFKYDSLGSTSSIATAVNSKIIKAMPFIVPSEIALSKFETLSKMYFDKINLVNQQIDSLAKLRDTLLPKLMSGEIRIPDAAAMVEEV